MDDRERQGGGLADSPVPLEVTRQIIGAFYAVYDDLLHGYLESVYATAMFHELQDRGLRVAREVPIEVVRKGRGVGFFRADLVVEREVVLEIKASVNVSPADHRQVVNYLTATNLPLAFLLHFGHRPRFYRYVSTRRNR